MSFPLVKFVDSPKPTAAVRFDFNVESSDAPRRVGGEGFTLGVPTLEGDPDAVEVSYGWRELLVPHRVNGSKQSALAVLSTLSRELLRPTNWLLVQLDALTAPVWFKTYRTAPAALSLDRVYVNTETGEPADRKSVV